MFENAETFIWKNGRLIERTLFAYHFKNGTAEAVVRALTPYQNGDGGFGNGLEPDIRCPDSQPVPTQHALEFLDVVGFKRVTPMVNQICGYLTTITTPAGGVPWLLHTAVTYPRAPWWQPEEGVPASLNPTAAVVGLLHKNRFGHPWLKPATAFCWREIEKLTVEDKFTAATVLTFLRYVPNRERAEKEMARVASDLRSAGLIANLDAEGYVSKPLDWAPTPDHPLRQFFTADEIEANLNLVIEQQEEDGGWPVPWPTLSPAVEQEWRGWITLGNVLMLQANGKLT